MINPGQCFYIILSSRRQGTSARYDLARFGDASKIILADILDKSADSAANHINQLVGNESAVSPAIFMEELNLRGIQRKLTYSYSL